MARGKQRIDSSQNTEWSEERARMEKIPVTFNYLKGNAAFLLILVGQMYCCERDVNFHPLVHGHS